MEHYENFPVASFLCPRRLRPAVAAIYGFARTADDLADEGDTTPDQRLADLQAYRSDLALAARGEPGSAGARWPDVFGPLAWAIRAHQLPVQLLADLLSAFEQDIVRTRDGIRYADREELLGYCRLSANPVGRLVLHLYGVHDERSLAQSDAICSALQLINFWQDPSVDLPRARNYFTLADCAGFGVRDADLLQPRQTEEAAKLIADYAMWARATMQKGAELVYTLPGRAGWELRLVVQGGLRILDKIERLGGRTIAQRPVLSGPGDWGLVALRACGMSLRRGAPVPMGDNPSP